MTERKFGIHGGILKVIALFLMLLDHAWATIIPGNDWMTWLGRMAFPIFAFQLAEGFVHTSDVNKYIKRLLIFALISELPLNLIFGGGLFFPFHQNVMFTLLFGLLAVRSVDKLRVGWREEQVSGQEAVGGIEHEDGARAGLAKGDWWLHFKRFLRASLPILGYCALATVTLCDYNYRGVLTVVMFYLFREIPYAKLWQLLGMLFINVWLVVGQELVFTIGGMEIHFPVQGFSVFALLFIWLYNGRRGWKSKAFQYACYIFYPLHAVVLYLIWLLK
ncbi:MAG: conjugal transfer protein TraX [Lachnospiraceae bacterium]|nr:conjugal transfer protein TraX [Lachnospiraceae bacterium]